MEFASEGIEYMEERALCTLMCAAYSPLYSAAHAQSTGNVPDISALRSVFSGTMPHARCASHRNGAVHDMVQPPLQSPAVHPHGTASQIETRDHMRIDHKAASGIVNNLIRYQKAGICVVYTVAMEGGFGTVQQMKGRPATSYEEVDPSAVVVCKIDKAGADANVAKFIKRRAYKIFHQYPQVSTLEAYVVYKPHYACLCQKGERRFFRILDAEIKDRNFMLDIKFRELTFMDKDAANDRIDPALFFPENSPAADEL